MTYEATKEFTNEVKELKGLCFKAMGDEVESMFMDLDNTTLSLLQGCFRLLDKSMELMEAQAEQMDRIQEKVDYMYYTIKEGES